MTGSFGDKELVQGGQVRHLLKALHHWHIVLCVYKNTFLGVQTFQGMFNAFFVIGLLLLAGLIK